MVNKEVKSMVASLMLVSTLVTAGVATTGGTLAFNEYVEGSQDELTSINEGLYIESPEDDSVRDHFVKGQQLVACAAVGVLTTPAGSLVCGVGMYA